MNLTSKILTAVLLAAFAIGAQAQPTPKPKEDKEAAHKKEAVAQHRAMAKAHEDAAKCLESGKEEKACHDQLQRDCKGIGIGKYCGMRHSH
jgi:uncharacterized protein involved in copper resistance